MDGHKASSGAEAVIGGAHRRASTMPLGIEAGTTVPEQGGEVGVADALALESQAPAVRTDPEVTVIVPTRNESGNVEPLVRRLSDALHGHVACILFVDDSDDDTPDRVEAVAKVSEDDSLTIRLHHRRSHERTGGLGGAVLAGLRQTTSPWAVVMDGDLQHPPELVPRLVEAGVQEDVDVVVASRHVPGGSTEGLSNGVRVLVSDLSTRMSKVAFPRRLGGVSDPMSGFFAVRPAAFDLDVMRPAGFKILLEMLARTPGLRKSEVPFVFGERISGDSKASVREGVRFVRQLAQLSMSRMAGRSRAATIGRGVAFAAVGATGLVVNLLATWLLAGLLGFPDEEPMPQIGYLVAAALATQVSSTWNFLLTDQFVYRGPKRYTRLVRWVGFMGMSNVVLLLRIPLLWLLVEVLDRDLLTATALTLILGFLVRFKSQERLTLTEESE